MNYLCTGSGEYSNNKPISNIELQDAVVNLENKIKREYIKFSPKL